jgi:preprotein translocase subunit SecG
MAFIFYTIHVLVCLFLILVVLLQQGKGADLSVFGGGGTQTAFGARGAATVLHKATVASFVLFILTTLAIGILQGQRGASTVMGTVPAAAATEEGAADTSATDEATPPPAALPEAAPVPSEAAPEGTTTPAPETAGSEAAGGAESESNPVN